MAKISAYFTSDIWDPHRNVRSGIFSYYIATVRTLVLTVRLFREQQCALRASALTYYSLLSIVPFTAILFSIAQGFGLEKLLADRLREGLQGQQEAVQWIISFSHAMLEKTKGGLLAGAGVAMLLWTVIKLFGTIENAFNYIWDVEKPRSPARKFSDYLSAIFVCPVLFIISGSLTVAFTGQAGAVVERLAVLKTVAPFLLTALKIVPYCSMWLLFGFLYLFMPNTKVNHLCGIWAGIIAGSLYQIVQWFYIKFQIGIASYGAIYGGFAALPLFLVWLQTSWTIVLVGAVVSRALHNLRTHSCNFPLSRASHFDRRILALCIAREVVKAFLSNEQPPTEDALADRLRLPVEVVKDLLKNLCACGVLCKSVSDTGDIIAYLPGRNPETLTIATVMEAYDRLGVPALHPFPDYDNIASLIKSLYTAIATSPDNRLIKDI